MDYRKTKMATITTALFSWGMLCLAQDISTTGPWGPQPEMHPASEQKSTRELPFRSWQFQNDNLNIGELITAASDFGVNNIQLSHDQTMFAHKLLSHPDKIRRFNAYIELAHSKSMTVHVWTHDHDPGLNFEPADFYLVKMVPTPVVFRQRRAGTVPVEYFTDQHFGGLGRGDMVP